MTRTRGEYIQEIAERISFWAWGCHSVQEIRWHLCMLSDEELEEMSTINIGECRKWADENLPKKVAA